MAIEWFFRIYIVTIAVIFGAVAGSFVDCLAWRLVRGERVSVGRSHCDACGHVLGVVDLIPIFGYLIRRGRCAYCGERIPARCLWVELGLGAVFGSLALRFGASPEAIRPAVLCAILMCLSLVDLESYLIPDKLTAAAFFWWLVTLPFGEASVGSQVIWGLAGAFGIGGSLLILSLLMDFVLKKESMGGGDIKLLFVLGLYQGPVEGLFHLILALIIGILMVVFLKNRRIPFGPAISLAYYLCAIEGGRFAAWYMSLL